MSILVTLWGETEHFSGKNGALRWSILVGKKKHNVQKPNSRSYPRFTPDYFFLLFYFRNKEYVSGEDK